MKNLKKALEVLDSILDMHKDINLHVVNNTVGWTHASLSEEPVEREQQDRHIGYATMLVWAYGIKDRKSSNEKMIKAKKDKN